ncbi:GNAT family N-acetyltransferase [Subtercola boreus]|uniref:GNAT family N-acetyltransferase n=1 Tax=Subtercola boreus TaxID=120213 RepID=UPI001559B301|nr:GNAT family N-acetyltransferase [Subtercola boreus]
MTGFSIERLEIPPTLDGPGGADFREGVAVRNASEVRAYGTAEVEYSAEELFPNWHDEHAPKVLWVARVDGRIVGRAIHETQLRTAAEVGWLDVDVHPLFEQRGIGRALAETVEQHARGLGESRLLTYVVSSTHSADNTDTDALPERRLVPPTGYGSVPSDNREVRFLLARGYRLEQVERASRLALPADPLGDGGLRQDARAAASAEYDVHLWRGATLERWLGDVALMLTRMSTDAPTAGLDEPEDVWTVERLADHERRENDGPRVTFTAAVEHRATGRLVAFNQLAVPLDTSRPVGQQDTLVLREHRGHRPGTLVKLANLDHLQSEAPGHPSILTWNAEENRFMLRVNEAMGFVPIGYEGAWRLDL